MSTRTIVYAGVLGTVVAAGLAHAQEAPREGFYTTKQQGLPSELQGQALPFAVQGQPAPAPQQAAPVPAAPSPQQPTPNQYVPSVPFGKASPDALVPAPVGPRTSVSAPVESIDAGEATVPESTVIEAEELPPAITDPTTTTTQSGAVFATEAEKGPIQGVLRGLNKVTAQTETLKLLVGGDAVRFGRLEISVGACRTSLAESQQEFAALVNVKEHRPQVAAQEASEDKTQAQEGNKSIFNGWMFASSPSLNGLEHPIYDLALVRCQAPKKSAE
jgi:hypothetical protein